jgi:hypothetical protein
LLLQSDPTYLVFVISLSYCFRAILSALEVWIQGFWRKGALDAVASHEEVTWRSRVSNKRDVIYVDVPLLLTT